MDVLEFQEKLKELCQLAKEQGSTLAPEQVQKAFQDIQLQTEQMKKTLQYLKLQGISIEGTAACEEESASAEPEVTGVPLTAAEQSYLREYLDGLSEPSREEIDNGFSALSRGDAMAQTLLVQAYLPVAARLAAKMNSADIPLADLIQEANVCLLEALDEAGTDLRDDAWLCRKIRDGLLAVQKERAESKFRDDSLVAKVEKLEAAVRDLADEDGENRFTLDELAVILDMKPDEIRDVLRLTGDE